MIKTTAGVVSWSQEEQVSKQHKTLLKSAEWLFGSSLQVMQLEGILMGSPSVLFYSLPCTTLFTMHYTILKY